MRSGRRRVSVPVCTRGGRSFAVGGGLQGRCRVPDAGVRAWPPEDIDPHAAALEVLHAAEASEVLAGAEVRVEAGDEPALDEVALRLVEGAGQAQP